MFKRLFNWFKDEFELSYSETKDIRNFFLVLIGIAALSFAIPYFLEASFDKIVIENYEEKTSEKQKEWVDNKKKAIQASSNSTLSLDFFDPNEVKKADLLKMGIPVRVANNLINFRNKGMVYKTKNDVAKVYGLDSTLFIELQPYIKLPIVSSRANYSADNIIYDNDPKPTYKKFEKYAYKRPEAFDINTASVEELVQIKGIGEVFAKRIIDYRKSLGGFHSIDQVENTYNLSPEAFDSLAVVAVIRTTHKKFNINSIEIGAFKHPHLKYFQIKGIVNYRKQHGDFESFDDLQKLKVLNSETLSLIKPYISFTD